MLLFCWQQKTKPQPLCLQSCRNSTNKEEQHLASQYSAMWSCKCLGVDKPVTMEGCVFEVECFFRKSTLNDKDFRSVLIFEASKDRMLVGKAYTSSTNETLCKGFTSSSRAVPPPSLKEAKSNYMFSNNLYSSNTSYLNYRKLNGNGKLHKFYTLIPLCDNFLLLISSH